MRQLSQSSARKKLYVPGMLAWNRHLRAWRNVSRQQDAAEFWAHLMLESEPDILAGTWESRQQVGEDIQVRDSALLWQPLQLAVQANTLQSIVDLWQAQLFPHALAAETPCVVIQLKRYSFENGVARKLQQPIELRPGAIVQMPVFERGASLCIRTCAYRIIFAIVHTGLQLDSGHYQCILSCGRQLFVSNDGVAVRPVKKSELSWVDKNAYLYGLLRLP